MITKQWKPVLQLANLIIVFCTILMNILANALPINGRTTGELSDAIPNLFVPSGITFSIWGIIYVLWVVFALYQGRDLFRKEKQQMPFLSQIHGFFVIAGLANILWIILWHYQFVLFSLIAMLMIFSCLVAMYLRLDIGHVSVPRNEKWCVHVPLSVYLGWITVATIANVTAVLVSSGVKDFGLGEVMWTMLIIIVAALIGLLVLFTRRDIAYTLVLIWAFLGITLKRVQPDPLYGVQNGIAMVAAVAALVLMLGVLIVIFQHLKRRTPSSSGVYEKIEG